MPASRKKIDARRAKAKRPLLHVIPSPSDSSEAGPIRWSKVKIAQSRVAEGYYDREEVRELLLREVMEELTRG